MNKSRELWPGELALELSFHSSLGYSCNLSSTPALRLCRAHRGLKSGPSQLSTSMSPPAQLPPDRAEDGGGRTPCPSRPAAAASPPTSS